MPRVTKHGVGPASLQRVTDDFAISDSPALVERMAVTAFMFGLLGLILPIVPAIVTLVLAHIAAKRIRQSEGLLGGMMWVRGAQVLAILNFLITAGIIAAAAYLPS
jgi:uncharacterized protein YqgC (DUF456 family)